MSTGQWLLLVGMRVVDVGLLVAWLVWFFKVRDREDDDEDSSDDGPGGGPESAPRPRPRPSGPGRRLPQARRRIRSHRGRRSDWTRRRRGTLPAPAPARVRRPSTPVPAHRPG